MANRMTHEAHLEPKADRPKPPKHSGAAITMQKIQPWRDDGIVITSPAIGADGRIDPANSAAEDGPSPELNWEPVEDAKAFALIVEDPDAPREQPFVHWMIWNIPGQAVGLPAAIPAEARLVSPQDVVQAKNDAGMVGWHGPKPPPGHGVHHYYFQLFALDAPLELDPATTDLRALVDVIKGAAIVAGQLVGTFETPEGAAGAA